MAEIPPILSDAWAIWVVEKLGASGEVALSDEDIAAIISNIDSDTRNVLNTLIAEASTASELVAKAYTDTVNSALSTSLGRSIANGDVQSVSFAKTYTDAEAAKVLAAAKAYTDTHAGTGGVSAAYVDNGDTNALAQSKSYTDGKVTETRTYAAAQANTAATLAQEYTDDQLADYLTKTAYDLGRGSIISEAANTASQMDATTLTAAKAYTDAHSSDGVDSDYVDQAIGSVRTDTTAAINTAIQDAKVVSDAYTDDAVSAAATAIATTVDAKVAGVTDYVDDADAEVLRLAKLYTDENGGTGTGGVTQAYVDNADTNTLTSARGYADTQSAQALASAKTYADAKPTKPASGWAASDLAAAVQTNLTKASTALQPDTNGWVSVPTASEWQSNSTLKAKLDGITKMVKLRSIVQRDTNIPAGTKITAVATLPAGSRPVEVCAFICSSGVGAWAQVTVNTNGTIDITINGTNSSYARLDAIEFSTV